MKLVELLTDAHLKRTVYARWFNAWKSNFSQNSLVFFFLHLGLHDKRIRFLWVHRVHPRSRKLVGHKKDRITLPSSLLFPIEMLASRLNRAT